MSQQHVFTHPALERFEELSNNDIEMAAPLSEHTFFVVIDTNILLHFIESLTSFVADIEKYQLPIVIIVPKAVVLELDRWKGEEGEAEQAWFSRKASSWLLAKLKERRVVKGQARNETDDRYIHPDSRNDDRILACALYFRHICKTFLFSRDNNLCVLSESEDLPTIVPSGRFSSRDIARSIYSDGSINLGIFSEYHKGKVYKYESRIVDETLPRDDSDDFMEVDEVEPEDEDDFLITRSDARTVLHLELVEHFTAVLAELVRGVNAANPLSSGGAARSIYAPAQVRAAALDEPKNQDYEKWTASQLIAHLERRKNRTVPAGQTLIGSFLTKPYRGNHSGARRGEEWAAQDWRVCLNELKRIGEEWKDKDLLASLVAIQPHIQKVVLE